MISPRQWIISQKYGKRGALQVNPQKTKGPQIQPVKALAGGLLMPGIRVATKVAQKRFWPQKLAKFLKKYKRQDINYTKLEIKRGKAKDLMTMLKATSAKTGPLNNTEAIKRLTKYRSNKFTEGMEYMKKKILKSQKKLKLHSTGGLIIGKNVDRSLL